MREPDVKLGLIEIDAVELPDGLQGRPVIDLHGAADAEGEALLRVGIGEITLRERREIGDTGVGEFEGTQRREILDALDGGDRRVVNIDILHFLEDKEAGDILQILTIAEIDFFQILQGIDAFEAGDGLGDDLQSSEAGELAKLCEILHGAGLHPDFLIGFAVAGYFGPTTCGKILAKTGSYSSAFIVSIALVLAGLLLSFVYTLVTKKSSASGEKR
jgi:hypothetical protein